LRIYTICVRTLFKLFFFLVFAGVLWFAFDVFVPPSGDAAHEVVIKPGSSSLRIGEVLQDAGAVRSGVAFFLLHQLRRGRSLKAGDYQFEAGINTFEVHEKIARGEVSSHVVVVPEGFNIFDIAQAVAAAGLCTREEFLAEARDDRQLVADLAPNAPSLEGYLFPDTYNFTRLQSAHDIAAVMVKRFRQEARSIGLTHDVNRTVTLASFIEKETRIPEERPIVASVFENRLAQHIPLATDPSVIYASRLIGKFDGVIHESDLQLDSPYNTYKSAGLPPGPIANPGRDALLAAMHPAKSDYLYFVANNRGGHNFAKTLEEHDRNVAAYRRGQR